MSPVGGDWEREVGGRGLGWGWAEEGKLGRLGGRGEGWLLCWVALPGFSLLLADWALASPAMSVFVPYSAKCG